METNPALNPVLLRSFSRRKVRARAKHFLYRRREFDRKKAKERMMFVFLVCSATLNISMPRTLWQKGRDTHWWEEIVNGSFTAHDWLLNFRMSRTTFLYLCNELRADISKTDTDMRPAISVEKRVALTLWFMSTNTDYRTIGHLFGVSTASVCKIRQEVCQTIVRVLLQKYIRIPTDTALSTVVSGFVKKGFPQCGGVIDGCHIPIEAPQQCPADYHNRKGWHSVILQGLVDHNGCFTDINVGWPGRVHDARVLHNSELFSKAESGSLFPQHTVLIGGARVPIVISMKIWIPLSRLTYNVSLINFVIIDMTIRSAGQVSIYWDLNLFIYTAAAVVLSYGAAGVLAAFVEYPLSNLEVLVFRIIGIHQEESIRLVSLAAEEDINKKKNI